MARGCRMHDGQVVAPLGRTDARHAIYVDNFLVTGHCPSYVDQQATALGNRLNAAELVVHEVFSATTHATFAGVDYDGERLTARVSARRVWRLRFSIDYILGRHGISGRSLEKILGHFTWSALLRCEALATVCACYEFVRKSYDSCTRIWASVRRELRWMRSLLPLLESDMSLPWLHTVVASDASDTGMGVCIRSLDSHQVARVGRLSEKWRFRVEEAQRAREHALANAAEPRADPAFDAAIPHSP